MFENAYKSPLNWVERYQVELGRDSEKEQERK